MTAAYQLPIDNQPGTVDVVLAGKPYRIRTRFSNTIEGGWTMDIYDVADTPLACGLAVVTGCDILGQLRYLGIGGKMFVTTQDPAASGPSFTDLGVTSFIWFEPD